MTSESIDPRIRFQVTPDEAGRRLDVVLSGHGEIGRRTRAQELTRAGCVTLDGTRAKAGSRVAADQWVEVRLVPAHAIEVVDDPAQWGFDLRVLYEDPHLLVIDKPPGLAAHRPDRDRRLIPNVADLALAYAGELAGASEPDRPGIVHRLDRDTSGVMVLAKDEEAMHFLKGQFKARTVDKEYLAIVFGEPQFDSDWVDRPIGVHPRQGDKMTVATEGGREASTYYEVVERFRDFALVKCRPKTGRTHQIRVHLTSIGHSLVGDRVYVSRNAQHRDLPDGAPDPGRQCLHARRLAFDHPRTHERCEFDAPIPADMQALLEWLRLHRSL